MKTMKQLIATLALAAFAVAATSATVTTANAAPKKSPTIVEIALAVNAETGEFSTLIAALEYTGLTAALNGKKQFTVFAPTDAAFAKLGLNAGNIDEQDKDFVTNVLLYHVAHGSRLANSVVNARQIRMLNGDLAYIGAGPTIDGAGFDANDIKASNGVIHIVDTVLLPPE